MATSQLKRTVVTPPGTQYSGVKKLETVSVAELNAYVLTSPISMLMRNNTFSFFLILDLFNSCNSFKCKLLSSYAMPKLFRLKQEMVGVTSHVPDFPEKNPVWSPPSHTLHYLTQMILVLSGCLLKYIDQSF
ncbi:hypothetical protein HID58_006862 [Brassica napus]|uniref:Uncharacterized protein n=1 Tax=Brassica napus TaxID=3708 RepID=A0ABQ8ECQ6_BRANA|nr:hypothetical protein HID58_006862 [Brassica napus]